MATFAVQVVPVLIEPHHNADALEIARIGGYCSVVGKGAYTDGDLVAYIPEQSIVPGAILEELGLTGRLAGSKANRVKAIRLRGVLSQGICYPARPGWIAGQDVTEDLGIVKYEPPVPTTMSGLVYGAGHDRTLRYDIENIKRYPDVLVQGEAVVFTEKIHGTWAQLGLVSPQMAHPEHGRLVVSSKGFASRGLAFVPDAPENADNLYLRVARHLDIAACIDRVFGTTGESVFVLGEVFGRGVQDLAYAASAGADETLGFRVFDIYVGDPGIGKYLDDVALSAAVEAMGLSRVPVVYRGPLSATALAEHTGGLEAVSGKATHIREGVVVRPGIERRHLELGRVQLKSINPKYLTRKGGTEFN
ncbi:MAG: RNA ligase (TIGR02306 family) [Myxococcota bacterium]|jgi:RNA ligase (TIGR02306 family)